MSQQAKGVLVADGQWTADVCSCASAILVPTLKTAMFPSFQDMTSIAVDSRQCASNCSGA